MQIDVNGGTIIGNLQGYITAIRDVQDNYGPELAFRGQASTLWDAVPSIKRKPTPLEDYEYEAVRDIVSIHPDEFLHDKTMFDRLVRMQHYGLPTRLLDVTTNPLVALHFAAQEAGPGAQFGSVFCYEIHPKRRKYYDSDTVSCLANLSNLTSEEKREIAATDGSSVSIVDFNNLRAVKRLAQFIREEKPYFESRIERDHLFLSRFVIPKKSNRRIIAQSGAFMIYGISQEKDLIEKAPMRRRVIMVDNQSKDRIRDELSSVGINEASLFPEIESAARFISAGIRKRAEEAASRPAVPLAASANQAE